jgi:DNA-directed RNA polymerase sigma subunit (sigma70/sigma32)
MIPHREVLKPDQEIELIQLAQAKPKTLESDRAFRTLIDHNQGLIVKIVKPFISDRQHLDFEDLMQEGQSGSNDRHSAI